MLWLAPWASKTDSRRGIDDRRKSRKPEQARISQRPPLHQETKTQRVGTQVARKAAQERRGEKERAGSP